MLGIIAEFETAIRKGWQMEGIANAKTKGIHKGRKPKIDAILVKEMHDEGTNRDRT